MKVLSIVFKEQTPRPIKGWQYEKHMVVDPSWTVDFEPFGLSIVTATENFLYPYAQIVRIQREVAPKRLAKAV